MKKTFFAMVMAGSSMVMFAQTNPTTNPTTLPVNPTTNPTLPTTVPAATAPINNGNVTNSTTDPMKSVTNPSLNNNSINATTNSVNNAAWTNGTPPSWTWRSYGIWDPGVNTGTSVNTGAYNGTTYNNGVVNNGTPVGGNVNSGTPVTGTLNTGVTNNALATSPTDYNTVNGTANINNVSSIPTANATMNSGGIYNAYSPVDNVTVPYNVQTNYSKDYPTASAASGAWSQYGDWFYTSYMDKGHYSQIFYDQKGNGYSVALPVLNTYVPDNIVESALQRYGSSLYSITMLKGAEGKDMYQVSLLDRGHIKTEYLGGDGVAVASIYRVDAVETQTADTNLDTSATTSTEATMTTTDENAAMDNSKKPMDTKKAKTKGLNEDGSKTKTGTSNGKTKAKKVPATQNEMNP